MFSGGLRKPITAGVHFTVTILGILALVGCQTSSFFVKESIEYNDKTLVIGGCENGLGRGFIVCRFIEGSPIESSLAILLPFKPEDVSAEVRVRAGPHLSTSVNTNNGLLDVPFKKIFNAERWAMEHDGPVQILATIRDEDGPRGTLKLLGFAYVVVLKPGYNPSWLTWPKPSYSPITCVIRYNPDGQSRTDCHE